MNATVTNPLVYHPNVEVLDYNDLLAGTDLTKEIEKAFGVDGPGILTVKNIPGITEARYHNIRYSIYTHTCSLFCKNSFL